MKRTAVTLSLLLAGVAGAADYATATKHDELRAQAPLRAPSSRKVQWAPTGNSSALHARAVFEEESGEAARPCASEGREVAAGSRIFLSRDTEAGDLTDAPSLHRYAYAHGNPLRYLDVDGRRAGDTPQENIERVKREILDPAQRAKNQQRGEEFVVREGLSEQQLDEQWRLATEEKSSLPVLPTSSERSMAEFRESGKRWVNRGIFVATLGVGGLGTKVATGLAKKFGLSLGTEAALDIALNTIEGYVVGAGTEAASQSIDIGVESRSAYDLGEVHEAGVEGAKNAFAGSLVRNVFRGLFGRAPEPVEVRSKVGPSGELKSAFAKIEPQNIGGGTPTNESSRAFVRLLGRETDDAGHAIGANLGGRGIIGGPTSRNVFSQDPGVNQGAFRVFEQGVARQVEAGQDVFVRVVPIYGPASTRPSSVLYQVRINGKTTSQVFPNP
ncbi:MAG: hypothetical protein AMXMBFR34_43420 [Myxococcaceae bacterium]